MSTTSPAKGAVIGAGAGVVASLVMAMFAMFASLFKDTGFLTPLYHIASLLAPGDALMASMKAGMAGDPLYIAVGTAIVGAIIHMMTGAMYGALFGVTAVRVSGGIGALVGIGVGYGLVVFLASAFVGLPLAASILGAGDPIKNMAAMAGWGTFATEHLMFGAALGYLVALRLARTIPHPSRAH